MSTKRAKQGTTKQRTDASAKKSAKKTGEQTSDALAHRQRFEQLLDDVVFGPPPQKKR